MKLHVNFHGFQSFTKTSSYVRVCDGVIFFHCDRVNLNDSHGFRVYGFCDCGFGANHCFFWQSN